MSKLRYGRKKNHFWIYFTLIFGSILMIFPFFWMIMTSFKTLSESMRVPPTFLPQAFNFDNYRSALKLLPFGNLYINTVLLVIIRIICAVVFSSMAAFAFAKLDFPLKNLLFSIVIAQMMLPTQIFIIPQYRMLSRMGQLNTLFALVFPGLVSAFGTFFLRQFYMSLPDDLVEASRLDGCNVFQTFIRIMFPLTYTAVIALSIFTAIFAYAEMMWPLIVNMDIEKMTLSSGITTLNAGFSTNYPVLMAGATMAMIPMLLLYLVFQKQFIEGIALTGTKG